MGAVTARFRVKDVTDKNGQLKVVLRAKTQAEGANTENPILFPDAECPEQLIHMQFISSAVSGIFSKNADVTVQITGPA
jgi:hypothetical protein